MILTPPDVRKTIAYSLPLFSSTHNNAIYRPGGKSVIAKRTSVKYSVKVLFSRSLSLS